MSLLMSVEISGATFLSSFCLSARMTKSEPSGSFDIKGVTAWRTLRARRWRLTDPPTVLLVISPHFADALFVTGEI